MSKSDFVKKIADEYVKTGYRVVTDPSPDQLPTGISDLHVDMIARNDKENVVVQIKRRDELVDLEDTRLLAERVEKTPGWRFHLVAGPSANGDGEVPEYGSELDAERIQSLVDEAESGLASRSLRSAFLMAWAAAEASMRDAGRRSGLVTEREAPIVVLRTLCSSGLVGQEVYDHLRQLYRIRSALVHGLEPLGLTESDVRTLLEFVLEMRNLDLAGTAVR